MYCWCVRGESVRWRRKTSSGRRWGQIIYPRLQRGVMKWRFYYLHSCQDRCSSRDLIAAKSDYNEGRGSASHHSRWCSSLVLMPLKSGVLAFSSGLHTYSSVLYEVLKCSAFSDLTSRIMWARYGYEAVLYIHLHKTRRVEGLKEHCSQRMKIYKYSLATYMLNVNDHVCIRVYLSLSPNKHTVVVYYGIPNWFIPLRPQPFANIYDYFIFFVS